MKPTPQEVWLAAELHSPCDWCGSTNTSCVDDIYKVAFALATHRIETEERVLREVKEAVKNAKIAKENYEVFEAMQEALGTDAASWSRGFFEKENLALEAIDTYATSLRTSRGE